MTQYNCLNKKLFNSQFNKSNKATKNETVITLLLSSNIIGNYNDKINFPYKLLLADGQVSKLRKAFPNNLSANIKPSKTQLYKIIQSGGIRSRLLGSLLKTDLPITEKKLKPLTESVLITLGLTAAATSEDAGIHKNFHFGNYNIDNFKWRIGKHYKNSLIS